MSHDVYETHIVDIQFEDGREIINGLKEIKILGHGSFSTVKLMEDLKTGINYAVKIVDKKALAKKNKNPFMRDSSGDLVVDNQLQDAMREIAIMTKLHHDNIIKLHRVIHDDQEGNMYLVMECCDKGPLMDYDDFTGEFTVNKNYINEEKGKFFYSEEEIKDIIRGVILGIDYLHFNNIIHKDLKHNNIILGENCQPKIIDFNISKIFSAKKKMDTKTEGTYEFMAPESFELSSDSNSTCILGKPLDIWALGVTVFIMVYNQLPFQTENFGDQIGLMNTITDAVVKFPVTRYVSEDLMDLISSMLTREAEKRLTITQLKENLWLNKDRIPLTEFKPALVHVLPEDMEKSFSFFNLLKVARIGLKWKEKSLGKSKSKKSLDDQAVEKILKTNQDANINNSNSNSSDILANSASNYNSI